MTFTDANVFVCSAGKSHPHRATAWQFFRDAKRMGRDLITSAKDLRESLNTYLPSVRLGAPNTDIDLLGDAIAQISTPVPDDVETGRQLLPGYFVLRARRFRQLAGGRCRNSRGIKACGRVFDAIASALT